MSKSKKNGKELSAESKDILVDYPEENEKTETAENESETSLGEKQKEEVRKKADKTGKSARLEKEKQEYKQQYEHYKKQYEDLNDQFLRLRAEFANYKKRVEREQIEYSDYLKAEIIKKLLPVVDDFNHMIEKSEGEGNEKSVVEGAKMINEKFSRTLTELGVEKIEARGKEFDPLLHEAMIMQKTDNADHHNKVINVFQEGYKIKDRLIRPSKVVVGTFEDE